jgi:hypothetical protein
MNFTFIPTEGPASFMTGICEQLFSPVISGGQKPVHLS